MPRPARLAVLVSFILHGGLIVAARYRLSYDAYNHMFFGDHYRMDWWSLWEPRWYTGFPVNSYPPLVHQMIGGLSHVSGLDAAFALLLWLTLTALPLAVYCFARIFTGRVSSGYAALGASVLPSAFLTAHIFGQLPTLAATLTALFGAAALNQYLREGDRLSGLLTISLFSTVMAFHHATLLLLPWLGMAVVINLLMSQKVEWKRFTTRLLSVGIFSSLVMWTVIWPFWEWGQTQSIQTPIDHASRHNFLEDPLAPMMFFLPMYGPLVILLPAALSLSRQRRLIGLGFAFCALFLLGLGGTTPLPRLLFGEGWQWLTYDRFAFWASLMLLPLFGMIVILLQRQRRKSIRLKVFLGLGTAALLVGLMTAFLPLQPGTVDMRQVRDFLGSNDRWRWRYLTFGFGDQLALLSTLTPATTIDGSYHTARTLPELRESGIGQIDTAFWLPDGLASLDPILQKAGEHSVRWGFVNIPQYIPVLERNGWIQIRTLRGGVQVWENTDAIPPSATRIPPVDSLASFSWGTFPLVSFIVSMSLGIMRAWPAQARRILRGMYAFVLGLLPLGLCFWYYRSIDQFPHDRVYFIYTDALFFLANGLVIVALILWLSTNIASSAPASPALLLPVAFCTLALLSVLWSTDWRTSLYVALQFLIVIAFVFSLRQWPHAWRTILLGFCAALSFQIITGVVQFLNQSTAFLTPLNLHWPGPLDPSVRGAIIVQLPGGKSFLRAYGTLPHPNILGGYTLTFLLAPVALFLRRDLPNNLAALLLVPGVALLALTFSRSAWLGLIMFSVVLLWKSKYFERKRLAVLLCLMALAFVLTLLPYRELVEARTINTTAPTEEFSLRGRAWLNGQAVNMIREYPLTGVGIGTFIIELARRSGEGYVIEPAHNILLLAGAELGIPGMLLVLALLTSFLSRLIKTQNPNAILSGAVLAGLGVISLFDHYLWTLAPGRLLLGLITGMFLGQDASHDT